MCVSKRSKERESRVVGACVSNDIVFRAFVLEPRLSVLETYLHDINRKKVKHLKPGRTPKNVDKLNNIYRP